MKAHDRRRSFASVGAEIVLKTTDAHRHVMRLVGSAIVKNLAASKLSAPIFI
jgi:hypothetical protein